MKYRLLLTGIVTTLFLYGLFLFPESICADSSYTGPLFDAHSHVMPSHGGDEGGSFGVGQGSGPSLGGGPGRRRGRGVGFGGSGRRGQGGQQISAPALVSLLREAGLSGVILFGPQSIAAVAQRQNPGFVHFFADVPRDPQTKRLLLNDQTLHLIEGQLSTGGARGIGEIPVRHNPTRRIPEGDSNPADGPIMLQIYDLAGRYHVPVNIHFEYEYSQELERALSHHRDTVIIWAHVGDAPASLVRELMRKHRNLYADISCRNPLFERSRSLEQQALTDHDGRLKEEWRSVFEEFPDRFLFGLDVGQPPRNRMINELVKYYRSVLGQLTPETAKKIAYKNARKLLDLQRS